MLRPTCEVSLGNLVRDSAILAPSLIEKRDNLRSLEISLSDNERIVVTFERFPPLPGWRISELTSFIAHEEKANTLWTRRRNQRPEQVADLLKTVDTLFERKIDRIARSGYDAN